ncbi:uncharacterized protein N7482_009698 [Penicillium canariense]|uniref:WSC domain-containing protein n=1 Tax=Penicillium canariense TaxID=189055 RepID=A0A9W9HRC8_9EURO|nr:uncharacterized protein N7482_009698 [Penicillium canariense]KAJ5153220.1 hypothetical protein N7482_009698 [Penicillium canariense]
MHPHHILASLALALPAFVSASHTTLGCYSEVPDLKGDSTNIFQAYGQCLSQCTMAGYEIAALSQVSHCACSNTVPPDSAKVDDEECKTPCPGYPSNYCGGDGTFMVLSTGQYAVLSGSDDGSTATATAVTAAGGIVVAPTNINPTSIPTSILTAPSSIVSSASARVAASSSATSAITAASSSASPSPTLNAAGSLRAGSSLAGALVAGLGLLL